MNDRAIRQINQAALAFAWRSIGQPAPSCQPATRGHILRLAGLVAVAFIALIGLQPAGPATAAQGGPAQGTGGPTGAYDPSEVIDGEVMVGFQRGTTLEDAEAVIAAHDTQVLDVYDLDMIEDLNLGRTFQLSIPPESGRSVTQVMAEFESEPSVEYAEPNFSYSEDFHQKKPNDLLLDQWSLFNGGQRAGGNNGQVGNIDADVDALQGWDTLLGGDCRRIGVIGVIDSGVDPPPDLQPNVVASRSFVPTLSPLDTNGHGTSMASIIAAKGNNGTGMTGICWDAKVVSLKVGAGGDAGFDGDAILRAIRAAVNNNRRIKGKPQLSQPQGTPTFNTDAFRVLNMSLGGSPSETQRRLILAAAASDILVVASAGNDSGNRDSNARYPCTAGLPNIICVASTTNRDTLCANSGRGLAVQIAAPGYYIPRLNRAAAGGGVYFGNVPGCGTSPAAAHVTGIAALCWSMRPSLNYLDMKDLILRFADSLPSLGGQVAPAIGAAAGTGARLRWPCSGDLGDAPNSYQTVSSSRYLFGSAEGNNGAMHLDTGNEFFGHEDTPEHNADTPSPLDPDGPCNLGGRFARLSTGFCDSTVQPNGDADDNPFGYAPVPPWNPGAQVTVTFTVCSEYVDFPQVGFQMQDASPALRRYDPTDPDHQVYANGFFDFNRNGRFDLPGERPALVNPDANIPGERITELELRFAPAVITALPDGVGCRDVTRKFVVPDLGQGTVTPRWVRWRLDYGEHGGANDPLPAFARDAEPPQASVPSNNGIVRSGEVEDDCQFDGLSPPEVTVDGDSCEPTVSLGGVARGLDGGGRGTPLSGAPGPAVAYMVVLGLAACGVLGGIARYMVRRR